MGMENLKKAFEIIHSFDPLESDFSGEKSEELIVKAEEALSLTFPETYRVFLREKGCGSFRGMEIYGVIDDNFIESSIPDGIWLTLTKRARFGISSSLIIIGSLGYGPIYVIDTSKKNQDGESPVCVLNLGEKNPTEKVNEDFGDFFLEQVTLSASYEDDDEDED